MEGIASQQVVEKLLELLHLCPKMNSVRERVALLELLAREASRLMDADRASIFLLDRDKHELWSTVALGSAEILRFNAAAGIAGAVVKTGQMINVPNAQSDPRFYAAIDAQTGYHTRNLLAAPLLNLEGQILGVFVIQTPFEPDELVSGLPVERDHAVERALRQRLAAGERGKQRMPRGGKAIVLAAYGRIRVHGIHTMTTQIWPGP